MSWDEFLGASYNISSSALFLAVMAKLSGYKSGKLTIQATNAHIYDNHFDQVKEYLARPLYELPKLIFSDAFPVIKDIGEIKGIFERINPDDVWVEDYKSGDPIKAEMAV